jgi:hypothetical protein
LVAGKQFDRTTNACARCSFHLDHLACDSSYYRSERLILVAQKAKLNVDEFLRAMGNSFLYSFAAYEQRLQLYNTYCDKVEAIISKEGWQALKRSPWFPAARC